jgi:hypothetical protein
MLPGLLRMTSLAADGESWMTAPLAPPDQLSDVDVRNLHALRLDGHSQPVLVVTGRTATQRVMAAFRSDDGSRLWTRTHGSAVGSSYVEQSAPLDTNRDGTADSLLVCTNEPRIQEYRLADGALLWESPVLGPGSCRSLLVIDANGRRSIVAIFSLGAQALDVDTRMPTWAIPGTFNYGGTLIANGESGPELAIFDSREIRFYDVATRSLLRTVALNWQLVAVHQPENASIHFLLVLEDSRLKVIDGITGEVRAESDPTGWLGLGRTLTSLQVTARRHVVSVSAGVGSFAYDLDIAPEGIFRDSFDRWVTPLPIATH